MRARLVALGILAYAVFLLALAPATLLDARLAEATGGRLRLAEARGTLWSGNGTVELRDSDGRGVYASALGWRLSFRSLLTASLAYDLALGRPASQFRVALTPTRFEIVNADLRLPAAALGVAVPRLAVLDLTGDLRLHVARLSAGARDVSGQATLEWRDAGSSLTRVSPLGDYELRVNGERGVLRATLGTRKGPLTLEGSGAWAPGRRPALTATARVPPEDRDELVPLLQLIAVQRGPGLFELSLR